MTLKQRRHFTMGVAALAASCLAGAALAQAPSPEQTTWDRINSSKTLRVGEFTKARIVAADGHDLVAQPF